MHVLPQKLTALASLCLILVGCAQTGPPLPPSLELPKPPTDLRATRKGKTVTLTWSEPTLTTDHQTVRYLGPTLVCRTAASDITTCDNQLAILAPPAVAPKPKKAQPAPTPPPLQTYSDTLPATALSDNPDAEFSYAVEVLNRNARGAGLSNRVHVPAITTLAPPDDLAASLNEDGVDLTWTSPAAPPAKPGVEYRYRIYRRVEGKDESPEPAPSAATQPSPVGRKKQKKDTIAAEVPVGPAGPAHFLDSIEWEKTYQYWITTVTVIAKPESQVQVEGDDSNHVDVIAHDVFPPAVPAGLQAAYSGEGQKPFIDLIWAPVASADLAGYNIYRSEAGGSPVRLNSELVKTPSYRDMSVASGKTYTYRVSAVDVRGNESDRSGEASESVP
ncbi:MAG: hypothetical protein WAK13_08935 [Terriglobales bacterium]